MKRLALVFPGQGSQYAGMGKELADRYATARRVFEEANDILQFDLRSLCFAGSIEELTRTENTQPALLALSVAAFRVYMEEVGAAPAYAAGHSLGEFSALACAGAMTFADALRIVRQRGLFMQEAAAEGIGAMCAVMNASQEAIEEACQEASVGEREIVGISNFNSPQQLVISGHRQAVQRAGAQLAAQGVRTAYLKVSAPFHSPLMKPAAMKLEAELKSCAFGAFQWPVLSNVTGRPYSDPERMVRLLTEQITSPVRWDLSMSFLAEAGVDTAVEIGPQKVLSNLMRSNTKAIACLSFEKAGDIAAVKEKLAAERPQVESSQTERPQAGNSQAGLRQADGRPQTEGGGSARHFVIRCLAAAVCTRNANWDNEAYQKGVIEPYRSIQAIQEQLDISGAEPEPAQMEEALRLLKVIFDTKRVAQAEQAERFREMIAEAGARDQLSHYLMEAAAAGPGGERSGFSID